MKLSEYLLDGANEQAVAVMAFLRNSYEHILSAVYNKDIYDHFDGWINIGRYENCREQGYVVSLVYGLHEKHYAFYEHRNSDQLCVLISNINTYGSTPSVDVMWREKGEHASKYDVDKAFNYGDILGCYEWIMNDMIDTLNAWKNEKSENN